MTRIDDAHAAMEADPDDDVKRLTFYANLVDCELLIILESEADGDTLVPRVFSLEDGPMVAVFDSEERLAEFVGSDVDYAALPGRKLVEMLSHKGLMLGLNLGVAPSSFLLPASAIDWLSNNLGALPSQVEDAITGLFPPGGLPVNLLEAIDRKLSQLSELASGAWLAGVGYDDGRQSHLLAVVGAKSEAQPTIAASIAEALAFSGIDDGELDVIFLDENDEINARLARVALRFDLPNPSRTVQVPGTDPGMDADRPPKLR